MPLRAADRAVTSTPAVLDTAIALRAQALPPLPDAPDTSRLRESQPPSTLGALIDTTGDTGDTGASTFTLVRGAVAHSLYLGQAAPLPLSPAAWHLALILAPVPRPRSVPGRRTAAGAPARVAERADGTVLQSRAVFATTERPVP